MRRWSHIAQLLKGRIGKQCRERWHNHLRPDIKNDTWSEEEDKVLIQAHSEIGNKWADIAKRLPGRTENSIKNHWNATKRRQFSRRSWRSSKYPRSGSLLQNYIKSVTIASTLPTSVLTTEEQNSTCNEEWKGVVASSSTPPINGTGNATTEIGHLSNTGLAPACHFNDAPDLLEKKSMHEMHDAAYLFDQLECGYMASSSESSKDFEMAMAWDAAIPMASSSESSKDLAPACHFNDAPDLLEKKSMHEMHDAAHLFDQLECGYMASSSESSKDFEMAMAWDTAIPMASSSESSKDFEMAMAWDTAIPMASSSESSKDFEMAMAWDAAIPMASSSESSKDFETAMAWDAAILSPDDAYFF